MFIENEIIDLLTEYAINERFSSIVGEDEEISAAKIHSLEKYSALINTLTDGQKDMFEAFVTADSELDARMEFLIYQQGLKDMFNLMMSLLGKQG